MIRARASLVTVAIAAAFLSCGEDEDAIRLAEFQNNLQMANATIDSLNYTVESSNLLIDELRARADSLQHVDDKLLASVQKLNREVKKWHRLATEQKRMNQRLTEQIERMKVEKQADKRSIAKLRSDADSLNSALLDVHTSIRRQSDHIRKVELDLAQAQDDIAELKKARNSVVVYMASEGYLKENGYLDTARPFGRVFRKSYRLIRKLDPNDPAVRKVPIGEELAFEGKLEALVDRYGQLKKGDDYDKSQEEGLTRITFRGETLGGVDVLAVIKE